MSYIQKGMSNIYNPGYGTGRRIHRRARRGGGFMDFLKKANNFVKDNQLISKGLALGEQLGINDKLRQSTLGNLALKGAQFATTKGYGRRRRRRRTGVSRKRTSTVARRRRRY